MPLPSELYDRDYFLSERCEGYPQFVEGGLSPLKERTVEGLGARPGVRVLDAGCGRGEMLLACARRGAEVAGIDYSEAAVELTRSTLADVGGADVRRGDVSDLPWPASSFDRVLFDDVIEHLEPEQVDAAHREFLRVLRPGGLLLVHTSPNRLFLDVGWPLAKPFLRAARRTEVVDRLDGWIELAKRYHINEQSLHGLRRSLRSAGFADVRAWIDPNVMRLGREYRFTQELEESRLLGLGARVAATRPLRLLLGNDLYALARR